MGRCLSADGGVADSGTASDGGSDDAPASVDSAVDGAACTIALGTVEDCTDCGDSCGWQCEGTERGCNDATSIIVGEDRSCATRDDGSVACWGSTQNGFLGVGGPADQLVPGRVVGIADAVEVVTGFSVGENHQCARTDAGAVYCWGSNAFGQLGDGTTTDQTSPVPTLELESDVTSIAAGGGQTCAVRRGQVFCWGFGWAPSPTLVELPQPITQVACGASHGCAVAADGSLFCWGSNSYGQLGRSVMGTEDQPPGLAEGITDVAVVAAGWNTTCALLRSGQIRCWGRNNAGQLGDGTTFNSTMPVTVSLEGRALSVATGGQHTCAAVESGAAFCWGANESGQLGDGTRDDRARPTRVRDIPAVQHLSAGRSTCAITRTGAPWCWGRNAAGQLGDGTTADRATPTRVAMPER